MPSSQALEQVTNASYQREIVNDSGTLAAGAELEGVAFSDNIKASGSDALFPWIRAHVYFAGMDSYDLVFWYVVKCLSTDALQNISDSAVLEGLQKTGKVFARGVLPVNTVGVGTFRGTKELEWKNVKLKDGEELRLIVHTLFGQETSGLAIVTDLEWRQTGV